MLKVMAVEKHVEGLAFNHGPEWEYASDRMILKGRIQEYPFHISKLGASSTQEVRHVGYSV
jgi:hypothetical protein